MGSHNGAIVTENKIPEIEESEQGPISENRSSPKRFTLLVGRIYLFPNLSLFAGKTYNITPLKQFWKASSHPF